ncbi:MAG: MBL fold metallo-hydrolase [Acidimicrobiales bacterium]
MPSLTFLGTAEFLASERYWNGFVIDGRILVETSPTVAPHLRKCGLSVADLDVVAISHFHADHTFGWPFLLLDLMLNRGDRPLYVVGPPGIEERLVEMAAVGGVAELANRAKQRLDLRFVEVDGSRQSAGRHRFRAVEVDHVPYLRCFGYLFEVGSKVVGYSGDIRPCRGLDELAGACDALVLECNGPHPPPATHMDVPDVEALRRRFPDLELVLTHRGPGIDASHIGNCVAPEDFETVEV